MVKNAAGVLKECGLSQYVTKKPNPDWDLEGFNLGAPQNSTCPRPEGNGVPVRGMWLKPHNSPRERVRQGDS